MENQNTTLDLKKSLFSILILATLFFCLTKSCNNKNLDKKETELKQSIDSSRIKFERLKLFKEGLEIRLDLANKELLEANNQTQISETNLYNLLKKNKRPAYVPEIANCNDTIQSVYNLSIKKDSAFNEVILNKNIELSQKDTIILIQNKEKINLTDQVNNKIFDNKKLESVIEIKDKNINKEKNKKLFWQVTTGVFAVITLFFGFK